LVIMDTSFWQKGISAFHAACEAVITKSH
jgi:hypothetical protein